MKRIVAGYFDSESEATQAMDALLKNPEFENARTEVVSESPTDIGIVNVMPYTNSGQMTGSMVGPVPVTGKGHDLIDDLDDEEAGFFRMAIRESHGVLALVQVEDHQVQDALHIFKENGARVHTN